jgi:hypothetical protein
MDGQPMLTQERCEAGIAIKIYKINRVLKLGQQPAQQREEVLRRTAADGQIEIRRLSHAALRHRAKDMHFGTPALLQNPHSVPDVRMILRRKAIKTQFGHSHSVHVSVVVGIELHTQGHP